MRMTYHMKAYILASIYYHATRRHGMNTARIFKSGNSQAVRLPKGFQIEGAEVYIKRIGRSVLLIPKDDPWASLTGSLDKFSEDFLEERAQLPLEARETL
jgi:antitoxin VapB